MNQPQVFPLVNNHLDTLLQDRERMLASLMGNLQGLVFCCLPDEHWTMVFVSDGCEMLTGYRPQELLFNHTVSCESITLPQDRVAVRSAIETAIAQASRYDIEYRIRHADGNIRWVRERGTPIYNGYGEVEAVEGFIQDITRRKQGEARYRSIFENAIEGIFQTSASGQYLNVNPALARIYGYDSAEALIAGLSDIRNQLYVDPGRRDEFVQVMKQDGQVQKFESRIYRRNGDIIWISENAREVRDEAGRLLHYEGTVEDITDQKSYEEQIQYQATHDSLTGLPNRSLLSDRLQQCINFTERYGNKVAVAFIDLDHFKQINDCMGHHIGDQLLVTMAERLAGCVRDSDTVVRLGGDEFVILLTSFQKAEDISPTMQRILASVAQPCVINDRDFIVSCSIGIGIYPEDGKDANTLLKNADSAMYKAKQCGRNNFQFFTPELNRVLTERIDTEYKLRHAIERSEFLLHYQPKVNFSDGTVDGAKALIRWQPPDAALVPPIKFIQVAEETGLIEEIGEWVLVTACQQSREFQRKLGRPILISVNVSPRQFQQGNLAGMVEMVLARTGVDPQYIELEITESTLAQDSRGFIATLHDLKSIGVKLAIDDFGTGYSSMAYLKDFPVDRLKIDKGFVSNLEQEPSNMAILKAIVALGHNFGLRVVAEGVETEYQREFLKHIGCDELQGYLFSKPLNVEKFETLLLSKGQEKSAVEWGKVLLSQKLSCSPR